MMSTSSYVMFNQGCLGAKVRIEKDEVDELF